MLERILVTGWTGFLGPWVIAELRRQFPGAAIHGAATRLGPRDPRLARPDVTLQMDLCSPEQIEAAVASSRPDAVVHLAVRKTGKLHELFETNAASCDHLLKCLDDVSPNARIVVVGSSAELGRSGHADLPIAENAPCYPVDDYGITKLMQSAIAGRQASRGQHVVRLRPFNLIGPSMPDTLLAGRCAALLREAADADGPVELNFGPLDTRRDYLDIRDLARGIAMALRNGAPGGLYHMGSGQSRSGHEVVAALIAESGLAAVTCHASTSPGGSLVPWQTADIGHAREELGWQPAIGWRTSIRDLWDWTGASGRAAEKVYSA